MNWAGKQNNERKKETAVYEIETYVFLQGAFSPILLIVLNHHLGPDSVW